jgi:peptide-methionine (R)-S-oxide reductase
MTTERSDTTQAPFQLSDEEWRERLTKEQYKVLRHAATERPFTGEFLSLSDTGTYTCAGCGTELFSSDTKFESHCGWPSFYDQLEDANVITREDRSHGTVRTEVLCKNCGGHLGHVFDDGPKPTGQRYCINSLALGFEKK